MTKFSAFVGLDVHKSSISIAVAMPGQDPPTDFGSVKPDVNHLQRRLNKLGKPSEVQICYEAGPTGYGLYRWLSEKGYAVQVIAPSKTPRKAGDKVKTDARDAARLAHFLRSGDLSPIRVPTPQEEAMRNLLRAREDAVRAERSARRQLGSFLLRSGRIWQGKSTWTKEHIKWIGSQAFDEEGDVLVLSDYLQEVRRLADRVAELTQSIHQLAPQLEQYNLIEWLQSFRGVQLLIASSIVVEIGDFRRFPTAKHFMSFLGLTPSEWSSGDTVVRGNITKDGNNRLRALLVQAAWSYRMIPRVEGALRRRSEAASEQARRIAWRAQKRLHTKFYRLSAKGKSRNKAIIAVARELAGFIWAVGFQHQEANRAA